MNAKDLELLLIVYLVNQRLHMTVGNAWCIYFYNFQNTKKKINRKNIFYEKEIEFHEIKKMWISLKYEDRYVADSPRDEDQLYKYDNQ